MDWCLSKRKLRKKKHKLVHSRIWTLTADFIFSHDDHYTKPGSNVRLNWILFYEDFFYYFPIVGGKIDRFMPFPRVIARNDTEIPRSGLELGSLIPFSTMIIATSWRNESNFLLFLLFPHSCGEGTDRFTWNWSIDNKRIHLIFEIRY